MAERTTFKECLRYAWHGSGPQWGAAWMGIIGGLIGGFAIWITGLKMPQTILDNPLWGAVVAIALGAITGVAFIFIVRLCWAPIHFVLKSRGGLPRAIMTVLSTQMLPILLMVSGVLAFVVLFGAGAVWFAVQLTNRPQVVTTIGTPAPPPPPPKSDPTIAVLSFELQQFSLDLRKFVLSNIDETWKSARSLEQAMLLKYQQDTGQTGTPPPMNFLAAVAIGATGQPNFNQVVAQAKTSLEKADYMNATQEDIKRFLSSYGTFQDVLLRYQEVTKANVDLGKLQTWVAADTRALHAFKDLKASSAATPLQQVSEETFISANHKFDRFLPRTLVAEPPH